MSIAGGSNVPDDTQCYMKLYFSKIHFESPYLNALLTSSIMSSLTWVLYLDSPVSDPLGDFGGLSL